MTAKEYLLEIRGLQEKLKISRKIAENYNLDYSSIHGIDYSGVNVQTSPKNAMEEAAWRMMERHEKALQDVCNVTFEINKRLDEINGLDNPLHIEILFERYYEGKDLSDIAVNIKKNIKTTNNLHGSALSEFQKKYQQEIQKAGERKKVS